MVGLVEGDDGLGGRGEMLLPDGSVMPSGPLVLAARIKCAQDMPTAPG